MDDRIDDLLVSASQRLLGIERRLFQAEVCGVPCEGSPRIAERRFGWGREAVAKGLREQAGEVIPSAPRLGRQRMEDANPQRAIDFRLIVEPQTQADPEWKSSRQYSNLSAHEVREQLLEKGYSAEELPAERTLRDILHRMNDRLMRIQKAKPLKKTKQADAIFDNVQPSMRR